VWLPYALLTKFGQLHYLSCEHRYDSNLHVLNKFLRHLTVSLSFQHMLMDFHARYILLHNTEITLENQDHLYMLQIHSLHDPILFSTHREYNFTRTLRYSLSMLLSTFITR